MALEMSFIALESIFEAEFSRKVAGEGDAKSPERVTQNRRRGAPRPELAVGLARPTPWVWQDPQGVSPDPRWVSLDPRRGSGETTQWVYWMGRFGIFFLF
jgi:hypothetical protein